MCKPWAFLPGPLGFLSVMRPSRKMTARSYSWTICKTKSTSWVHVHSSKGNCGFSSSAHCAYLVISLTFRQNQIVMGKSRTVNRPASITMIQPHAPKDPVRSAKEREKQRRVCLNVFGTLWHPYMDGEESYLVISISFNHAYIENWFWFGEVHKDLLQALKLQLLKDQQTVQKWITCRQL